MGQDDKTPHSRVRIPNVWRFVARWPQVGKFLVGFRFCGTKLRTRFQRTPPLSTGKNTWTWHFIDRDGDAFENSEVLRNWLETKRRTDPLIPEGLQDTRWSNIGASVSIAGNNLLISSQSSIDVIARILNFFGANAITIFLQHGVIHTGHPFLLRASEFDLFCCSSALELDYVSRKLIEAGKPNTAKLTGMPRFDSYRNLMATGTRQTVLIAPTWRSGKFSLRKSLREQLEHYFSEWESLLTRLAITESECILVCHPLLDARFKSIAKRLGMSTVDYRDFQFQNQLLSSKCLVTDYSSVGMEAIFAGVPSIHFRSIRDESFFKWHLDSCSNFNLLEEVGAHICYHIDCVLGHFEGDPGETKLPNAEPWLREKIFEGYPESSCEAIYEAIKELLDEKDSGLPNSAPRG